MNDSPQRPTDQAPIDALRKMIHGYTVSQAVYVAAKLGIPDLLASGPRNSDDLASRTSTDAGSLYRLMRALASVGVFREDPTGRFHLAPLGQHLRGDVPDSVRDESLLFGAEPYRALGDLLYSVLTGRAAFEHQFGMTHVEYLSTNPEARATFNRAMTQMAGSVTRELVATCNFVGISTLADIGGGDGAMLAGIVAKHPGMRGILFELPDGAASAACLMEATGLQNRIELVLGDALHSVPPADAYIMKSLLHLLDFEKARRVLENCRRELTGRERLFIVERVIPPGDLASWGKFVDLVMLVVTGGCERTEQEYENLLAAARFRRVNTFMLASGFSVIEAVCA